MRFVSISERAKIAQYLQTGLSRFFWMELHTEQLTPFDRR
jgi:hypothetical protein